jgi:hypothetical protein
MTRNNPICALPPKEAKPRKAMVAVAGIFAATLCQCKYCSTVLNFYLALLMLTP